MQGISAAFVQNEKRNEEKNRMKSAPPKTATAGIRLLYISAIAAVPIGLLAALTSRWVELAVTIAVLASIFLLWRGVGSRRLLLSVVFAVIALAVDIVFLALDLPEQRGWRNLLLSGAQSLPVMLYTVFLFLGTAEYMKESGVPDGENDGRLAAVLTVIVAVGGVILTSLDFDLAAFAGSGGSIGTLLALAAGGTASTILLIMGLLLACIRATFFRTCYQKLTGHGIGMDWTISQ